MLEMRETFWLECHCGNSYSVRGTVSYEPCQGWKVDVEEITGCCDLQPDARMVQEELQAQLDHEDRVAQRAQKERVIAWTRTKTFQRMTAPRLPRST